MFQQRVCAGPIYQENGWIGTARLVIMTVLVDTMFTVNSHGSLKSVGVGAVREIIVETGDTKKCPKQYFP